MEYTSSTMSSSTLSSATAAAASSASTTTVIQSPYRKKERSSLYHNSRFQRGGVGRSRSHNDSILRSNAALVVSALSLQQQSTMILPLSYFDTNNNNNTSSLNSNNTMSNSNNNNKRQGETNNNKTGRIRRWFSSLFFVKRVGFLETKKDHRDAAGGEYLTGGAGGCILPKKLKRQQQQPPWRQWHLSARMVSSLAALAISLYILYYVCNSILELLWISDNSHGDYGGNAASENSIRHSNHLVGGGAAAALQERIDFILGGFPHCHAPALVQALTQHERVIIASDTTTPNNHNHHHDESSSSSSSCCNTLTDNKVQDEASVLHQFTRQIQRGFHDNIHSKQQQQQDRIMEKKNQDASLSVSSNPNFLYGIHCPTAVFSHRAIHRLWAWSRRSPVVRKDPQPPKSPSSTSSTSATTTTKWIIALRHPVWQVESYYNARVAEFYQSRSKLGLWFGWFWHSINNKNNKNDIPTLSEILFSEATYSWQGMTNHQHQYELFLHQFGSTLDVTSNTRHAIVEAASSAATARRDINWMDFILDQVSQDFVQYEETGELSVVQLPTTAASETAVAAAAASNDDENPSIPIFLYTWEQLQDMDKVQSLQFRRALSNFVGLSRSSSNSNKHGLDGSSDNDNDDDRHLLPPDAILVDDTRTLLSSSWSSSHHHWDASKRTVTQQQQPVQYPESIRICDAAWDGIRAKLVRDARLTAEWMEWILLQAPGVTVSHVEHFQQSLQQWKVDPCGSNATMAKVVADELETGK